MCKIILSTCDMTYHVSHFSALAIFGITTKVNFNQSLEMFADLQIVEYFYPS